MYIYMNRTAGLGTKAFRPYHPRRCIYLFPVLTELSVLTAEQHSGLRLLYQLAISCASLQDAFKMSSDSENAGLCFYYELCKMSLSH